MKNSQYESLCDLRGRHSPLGHRTPSPQPDRVARERALAAAMVAVWDSQTLIDVASAVGHCANNAFDFENANPGALGAEALVVAKRLEEVCALLWRIEEARVFLESGE